jgi:hypothetical protein
MRLIPEYHPVCKLYLGFVQKFFNTRFNYGKAICEIAKVAHPYVDVEVFVSESDLPYLEQEFDRWVVDPALVTLNYDSPRRAIMLEQSPIFALTEDGEPRGILFETATIDERRYLREHRARILERLGVSPLELGFDFGAGAHLVNEDVVLLSAGRFQDRDRDGRLRFFVDNFPAQSFHIVPPLAGDVTGDLDMFLWPVGPKAWIVSQYPEGSAQKESIQPSLHVLREHGHRVHRAPGLDRIACDDIDTVPNYANGVILNEAALVPTYNRPEDRIVLGVLEECGYTPLPIDCSDIILSNCGIHCISKTVPKAIRTPPGKQSNRRGT